MTQQVVNRWSRRFVATSTVFLVAWQILTLAGFPRRIQVTIAVFGFILHMVFGKAYTLIPSYFDRDLAFAYSPVAQYPFTSLGAVGLTASHFQGVPETVGVLGGVLWSIGVVVFLGTMAWTLGDNILGRETGTSSVNEEREWVDRYANAFMPVGLVYLALGSYETLAVYTPLPTVLRGYLPSVTHLLAAGMAAMLIFAVGFRLLPRFLVANPPKALVVTVLPAGTLGPIILAYSLGGGAWFKVGAVLEGFAVIGFALAYAVLFRRSERERVGFYGVLAGMIAGVVAVLLGLDFAFNRIDASLVLLHARFNLLGFLGLTIMGVAYQFYPPNVGSFKGANDNTAIASVVLISLGLGSELIGVLIGSDLIILIGQALALTGVLVYAYLILGLFYIHQRS